MDHEKARYQRNHILELALPIVEKAINGEPVAQLNSDDVVPCADAPDLFFPEEQGNWKYVTEARSICTRCPVLEKCIATAALNAGSMFGVVGGITPSEWGRLRRQAKAKIGNGPEPTATEVA